MVKDKQSAVDAGATGADPAKQGPPAGASGVQDAPTGGYVMTRKVEARRDLHSLLVTTVRDKKGREVVHEVGADGRSIDAGRCFSISLPYVGETAVNAADELEAFELFKRKWGILKSEHAPNITEQRDLLEEEVPATA